MPINTRISKNIIDIIDILSFLLLLGAIIHVFLMPHNGSYEISIYQAYSSLFWSMIFLSIILSSISVFLRIFYFEGTYSWLYGFSVLVLSGFLVLLLQYIRQYAFAGQWDDVNHFSSVMNIIHYNIPDSENFYPGSHIYVSAFHSITGMDIQRSIILFPALFYILFIANISYAAWTIDDRPKVRGLILTLATPLAYSTFATIFRPSQIAAYLLPLVVGLLYTSYHRKSSSVYSILFILILIFLPFVHPWGVVAALVMLFIYGASRYILYKSELRVNIVTPILILFIISFVWITGFQIFGKTLSRIFRSFAEGISESHSLMGYLDKAQQSSIPLSKVLEIIIFSYGPILIYSLLISIVFVYIIFQILKKRGDYSNEITLFGLAVVYYLLAFTSLFRELISGGPLRFFPYIIAVAPLMVSRSLYEVISEKPSQNFWSKLYIPSIIIIFIFASIISIFGVYNSTLIGQSNQQFSYSEQAGVNFLVKNAVNDVKSIYSPFEGSALLSSVLDKNDLMSKRQESQAWWIMIAPDHFGYQDSSSPYNSPSYLFVTAPELSYYLDAWPNKGRITESDFHQLDNDPLWSMIYQSGDFTLWWRNDFK